MLDLADIRKLNGLRDDTDYWKATTAALCDEVERLSQPLVPFSDLDNIRRMLDDEISVPPWLVRGLIDQLSAP